MIFIKKILRNTLSIFLIIFVSFTLFLGIEWLTDGLQWYEYESDYYMTGTVIDKTVIGHQIGSEIYLTIQFENDEIRTYKPSGRSDFPNEYLFKTIAINKTYDFRIGVFTNNHYGRKKNEQVENIISATLK